MAKNCARNTNNPFLYNYATAVEEYDKSCKFQQLTYNLNFQNNNKKNSGKIFFAGVNFLQNFICCNQVPLPLQNLFLPSHLVQVLYKHFRDFYMPNQTSNLIFLFD